MVVVKDSIGVIMGVLLLYSVHVNMYVHTFSVVNPLESRLPLTLVRCIIN